MAIAFSYSFSYTIALILFLQSANTSQSTSRMSALLHQQPIILNYHNGTLLKGNITLHLTWYGTFTSTQRSTILDFIESLSSSEDHHYHHTPSVSSWWKTTERYRGGPCTLVVGNQTLDPTYSLGKSLNTQQLHTLAFRTAEKPVTTAPDSYSYAIHLVLTSADVAVDGFCLNRCGSHGSGRENGLRSAYAWVGNPVKQCPGFCAWPFHQPVYGPQMAPLVSPNGDVGVDGMVINLATVLAGAVTNPFDDGYYQGSLSAPLEAVSACTGIFGKGAYPGYAGEVFVEGTTGGRYNAVGVRGRKFLLPAMWDPVSSTCVTLV